jgi:uncharacterized protein (TIGR00266 family)
MAYYQGPGPNDGQQYGQGKPSHNALHHSALRTNRRSGYPPQHSYQQPQGYGAPPPQQGYQSQQAAAPQHAAPEVSDSGSYQGMQYSIKHRNTFSTLEVRLNSPNDKIQSIPGAMIHMSSTVQLQGKIKMSFKKFFTGGQMDESYYTGPGVVALTPTLMGDILNLTVDPSANGGRPWLVAKHAYLASTGEVVKDTKSQGIGKGMFSGDGLFVYTLNGHGIVWLTSFGAIEPIHLQAGEQHIVDNGHLVAWNCNYNFERAGGGSWQSIKTGEGLVCRFTGPGTVYIQTRNLQDFATWVYDHSQHSN